ncbi:hypothetical protein LJC61_00455 [Ruminococcaceae bacterium OttesenSCG-928-A16]|nr:hypothetical protein [Ruminococcaceae bacterium OttesenSCG-928-A16]
MMLRNWKKVKWLAVAFLVLLAVSIYRQICIQFFPNDMVRPVIVYFVYLLLLSGWSASIRNRITHGSMRMFLLVTQILMLLGITIRFLHDAMVPHYDFFMQHYAPLMRSSGYLVGMPIFILPLFGLYAAFCLGRSEEYRFNRGWYALLIPAVILVFLLQTNEYHHLIFGAFEEDILSYRPTVGMVVIVLWALALYLARMFVIYRRSREVKDFPRLRFAPLLLIVSMLALCIYYFSISFVVSFEIIEFNVLVYFCEILIWESCIYMGMVPVNTNYEEVFDRSTVAMQLVDSNGISHMKSTNAPALSNEIFVQLKKQSPILTNEGKELHLHAINGGYAIWQNDMSQTLAVIEELRKSVERLEYEGVILRNELRIQSDNATVKEQNRLYNQLTEEIQGQLTLLQNLLNKREWTEDKTTLFKKVCLVATYIKRRCNLRLVEQAEGIISNEELKLCYDEMSACLRQLDIGAGAVWHNANPLAPELAIFSLDLFELLLEYDDFNLYTIHISFESETKFMLYIHSKSDASAQIPTGQLKALNKENYLVKWQPVEKGARVVVQMV